MYKNIVDLHVHTDNSFDGNHSATFFCEKAEMMDLRAVAFTDHCEVDQYRGDDNYEKRMFQAFFEVSKVRSAFRGKLLILNGIELGQPFLKTVQQIRSNQDITNIKLNKDKSSATCKAKVYLPNRSNALDVDVKIASFQDTITSFLIMSKDYDTREDLKLLYTSKYDEQFSSKEKDEGYWGDKAQRSNSHSLLWTFKNQSLRFTTFSTEKRENYVKNPKMRSPENRYGVKYTSYFEAITIIYSDLHHCKKVEEYEAE